MKITQFFFGCIMMVSYLLAIDVSQVDTYNELISKSGSDTSFSILCARLERANLFLSADNYSGARDDFDFICLSMIPKYDDIQAEFAKMKTEEKILFLDAWHGRLHTRAKMRQLKDHHHNESKLLHQLDYRMPQVVEINGEMILQNYVGDVDDLVDVFVTAGLIEKSADLESLPSGNIKIKMKNDDCDSCCNNCKEGKVCKDEKKVKIKL